MFGAVGGRGGGTPSQAPSHIPMRKPSVQGNEGSLDSDPDVATNPSSPLTETKHRGQGLGLGQGSGRGRGLAGMSNVAHTAVVMEEEMMFERNLAYPNPNANLNLGGLGSSMSSVSEGAEAGVEGDVGVGGEVGVGVGGHYPAVQFGHPLHAANRPTAPLPPGPPLSARGTGTGLGTPTGGASVEGRSSLGGAGGGGGGNISKGMF